MGRILQKDYAMLFRGNKPMRTPYHVVFCARYSDTVVKVAVKKKVGNAVERNKIKRRMRSLLKDLGGVANCLLLAVRVKAGEIDYLTEKKMLARALLRGQKCWQPDG